MTDLGAGFLPLDRQLFGRSLGEAIADLVRQRWPHHTAKHVARRWALDPTTAANVVKGHVSERTITKAIAAEGWALLAPVGEALTGQSYADHLKSLLEETDNARNRLADHQAQVQALMARRAALEAGADAQQRGPRTQSRRSAPHGNVAHAPERKG